MAEWTTPEEAKNLFLKEGSYRDEAQRQAALSWYNSTPGSDATGLSKVNNQYSPNSNIPEYDTTYTPAAPGQVSIGGMIPTQTAKPLQPMQIGSQWFQAGKLVPPPGGAPSPAPAPGGPVVGPAPTPATAPGGPVVGPAPTTPPNVPAPTVGGQIVVGGGPAQPAPVQPGTGGGMIPVGGGPGLQSKVSPDTALPARFQPAQGQAALRTIDPATETVQGQLAGLMKTGNAVSEAAQAKAQIQAAERGLQNSSLAATAGTAAFLDYATKIAEMDANIYNAASAANQQARNAMEGLNVQQVNNFVGTQLQAELRMTEMQEAARLDMQKAAQSGDIQMAIEKMKQIFQGDLAKYDADTKLLLQGNASAAQVLSTMQTAITNIMNNPNLDANAKSAAVNQQLELARGSIGVIGKLAGDVNLSGLLTSLTPAPAPRAAPATETKTAPTAGPGTTGGE